MDSNNKKQIEYIKHKDKLIGLYIKGSYTWERTEFLTDDDMTQQLGLLYYDKEHNVKPHAHYKVPRNIEYTAEILFCISGRIVYTFYDVEENWKPICSCELTGGDVLCLYGAGHGAKAIEPTRLIEVKQGPFLGAKDKFYHP